MPTLQDQFGGVAVEPEPLASGVDEFGGIPVEEGVQAATNLPQFEQPLAITDKGPMYRSQIGPSSKLTEPSLYEEPTFYDKGMEMVSKPLLKAPSVETIKQVVFAPFQVASDIAEGREKAPLAEKVVGLTPSDKALDIVAGATSGVVELANFFSSPLGIATLGMGALPAAAQKAVSLAFATQMGTSLPGMAKEMADELRKPEDDRDYKKIASLTVNAIGTTGFTVAGAMHGLGPSHAEKAAFLSPPTPGQVIPPEAQAWAGTFGADTGTPRAETGIVRPSAVVRPTQPYVPPEPGPLGEIAPYQFSQQPSAAPERTTDARKISSATSLPEREVRPPVGQTTPLRPEGQAAPPSPPEVQGQATVETGKVQGVAPTVPAVVPPVVEAKATKEVGQEFVGRKKTAPWPRALVSKNSAAPGWRLTWFSEFGAEAEPRGHQDFATREEAMAEAKKLDFEPASKEAKAPEAEVAPAPLQTDERLQQLTERLAVVDRILEGKIGRKADRPLFESEFQNLLYELDSLDKLPRGYALEGKKYVKSVTKAPEPATQVQLAPAPPAEAPPAAKEPWEMTQAEFVAEHKRVDAEWQKTHQGPSGIGTFHGSDYQDYMDAGKYGKESSQLSYEQQKHRSEVRNAIAEGKPVPPEVLSDYPDLKPPAAPVETKVEAARYRVIKGDSARRPFEVQVNERGTWGTIPGAYYASELEARTALTEMRSKLEPSPVETKVEAKGETAPEPDWMGKPLSYWKDFVASGKLAKKTEARARLARSLAVADTPKAITDRINQRIAEIEEAAEKPKAPVEDTLEDLTTGAAVAETPVAPVAAKLGPLDALNRRGYFDDESGATWKIQQGQTGKFYVEKTDNGKRTVEADGFKTIDDAQTAAEGLILKKPVAATNVESFLQTSVPDVTEQRQRVRSVDREQAELRDEIRKLNDQIKELEKVIKPTRGSVYARSRIKASARKSDVAKYRELRQKAAELDSKIAALDESAKADRHAIDAAQDAAVVSDAKQPLLRRLDRAYRSAQTANPALEKALKDETRRVILEQYPDATDEEIQRLAPEVTRAAYFSTSIEQLWKTMDLPKLADLRRAALDAAVNAPDVPKHLFPAELKDKLNRFRAADRTFGYTEPVEDLSAPQLAELKSDIAATSERIRAELKATQEREAAEKAADEAKQEQLLGEAQSVADSAGRAGTKGGLTAKAVKTELIDRIASAIDELVKVSDAKITQREDGTYVIASEKSGVAGWAEIEPKDKGKLKVTVQRFNYSHDASEPNKPGRISVVVANMQEAEWLMKAMIVEGNGKAVIGVPGDGVFRLLRSGETLLRVWKDAKSLDTGTSEKGYTTSGGAEKPPSSIKTLPQWKEAKEYHGLNPEDKIHDWSPALRTVAEKVNPKHPEAVTTAEVDAFLDKKIKEQKSTTEAEPQGPEPAADLGQGLPEGRGMRSESEVLAAVKGVDTAGMKVNVITRDQAVQLTGRPEARGYGGFYWPENGEIYLVRDNMHPDAGEGNLELLREEVGHALLDTPNGKRMLGTLLKDGKFNLTEEEKDNLRWQRDPNTGEFLIDSETGERVRKYQEHQLLDEFIAKSARENLPWWKAAVERVRTWLAKMGLANLSNEETARLLLRQIRNETGAQATAALRRVKASNATVTERGMIQIRPDLFANIVAHHGTPHEVDKFSLDKVGTGEGAQVYGYGLYYAERPEVAKSYQSSLSVPTVDGKPVGTSPTDPVQVAAGYVSKLGQDGAERYAGEVIRAMDAQANDESVRFWTDVLNQTIKLRDHVVSATGNLYTVSISAKPEEFLDWDKPLSEQSEAVRNLFNPNNRLFFEVEHDERINGWMVHGLIGAFGPGAHGQWPSELAARNGILRITGQEIYESLARTKQGYAGADVSPEQLASRSLLEKGIPGIRYADAGSRAVEEQALIVDEAPGGKWVVRDADYGVISTHDTWEQAQDSAQSLQDKRTYNYVLFDDSKIKITAKNGQPVELNDVLPSEPAPGEPTGQPDLAEEKLKNRQVAGERVGIEYVQQSVDAISKHVQESEFNGSKATINPDTDRQWWERANELASPETGGAAAARVQRNAEAGLRSEGYEQMTAQMAPGLYRNELWNYAVRKLYLGDASMWNYMLLHNHEFQTLSPEDMFAGTDPGHAYALRAARERTQPGLWKTGLHYTKEMLAAAGDAFGVGSEAIRQIQSEIENVRSRMTTEDLASFEDIIRNGKKVGGESIQDILDRYGPERKAAEDITKRNVPETESKEVRGKVYQTVHRYLKDFSYSTEEEARFKHDLKADLMQALGADLAKRNEYDRLAGRIADDAWLRKAEDLDKTTKRLMDAEYRKLDAQAEKTADAEIRKLNNLRLPQGVPNKVRDILRDFLKSTRPLDIEAEFKAALKGELVKAGVPEQAADVLAKAIYEKRVMNEAHARVVAMERASKSSRVSSLIEDMLGTPYLTQNNPKWRMETAVRHFMDVGLSPENAKEAAKIFDREFTTLLAKTAVRQAERFLKKAKQNSIHDLVEAIRLGLLDPNHPWVESIARRQQFNPLDAKQFAAIAGLEQKLSEPNLNPYEQVAITEQMLGIMRHHGDQKGHFMQAASESFAASLLSGVRTSTLQVGQPAMHQLLTWGVSVAAEPRDFGTLTKMAWNATKNFIPEFANAWMKDATIFETQSAGLWKNELKRQFEIAEREWSAKKYHKAIPRFAYAWQQYVIRTLRSFDQASMAVMREYNLALYGSMAMRKAGFNTHQISEMVEVTTSAKMAAYERYIGEGKSKITARAMADYDAAEALRQFFANDKVLGLEKANQAAESALYDANNVTGRKGPGIRETDEGMLSSPMNWLMQKVTEARTQGGAPSIMTIMAVGFCNVPFRTARYYAGWGPYGLLRSGIHNYMQTQKPGAHWLRTVGLEWGKERTTFWNQTYKNELSARQRLREAIAGTGLMLAFLGWQWSHSTADDDAEKRPFALFATGAGPSNRTLRDSWIKRGYQPYSLHVILGGKVVAAIPTTRAGQILGYPLGIAAALDDVQWKRKQNRAVGRGEKDPALQEVLYGISTYYNIIGAQGIFQAAGHVSQLSQSTGGTARAIGTTAASTASALAIPGKSMLQWLTDMIYGPIDRSSLQAAMLSNVPVVNALVNGKAVNRFGDVIGDRSWYSIASKLGSPIAFRIADTTENRAMYQMIVNTGAAPPDLRRSTVEDKYGPLTQTEWNKFTELSGSKLKQSVLQNLSSLNTMRPEDVKLFLNQAAASANEQASAELGLAPQKGVFRNASGGAVSGGGSGGFGLPGRISVGGLPSRSDLPSGSVPRGVAGVTSVPSGSGLGGAATPYRMGLRRSVGRGGGARRLTSVGGRSRRFVSGRVRTVSGVRRLRRISARRTGGKGRRIRRVKV